jgi:hypothetical protein
MHIMHETGDRKPACEISRVEMGRVQHKTSENGCSLGYNYEIVWDSILRRHQKKLAAIDRPFSSTPYDLRVLAKKQV